MVDKIRQTIVTKTRYQRLTRKSYLFPNNPKMSIRLGGALKELRIHLCQTNKQSAGVRDFIQQNYVPIKKENPGFPILIRECSGIEPKLWARYARACETVTPLSNLNAGQIMEIIKQLASRFLTHRQAHINLPSYMYTDKGVERSTILTNLSAGDVLTAIKKLVK